MRLIETAIGITHLLASTLDLGHAFHVILTPSIPSPASNTAAAAAMSAIDFLNSES